MPAVLTCRGCCDWVGKDTATSGPLPKQGHDHEAKSRTGSTRETDRHSDRNSVCFCCKISGGGFKV